MTPGSYTEHGCSSSPTAFLGTRHGLARRARAAARPGRHHAADCGRGTCVHPRTEWVREVHADQDDHAPENLERANEALARLGIAHLAERAVAEMSSGEAKRTLIARALVHEPQTLLFDEPGNALDIAGQVELRETMRELARAGLGILLVTHHVSEIIPEIERVVLLQSGRILADGAKEKVLNDEKLSQLFGVSVRLFREDGYFYLHA